MEYTISDISPWFHDPVSLALWMETAGFLNFSNSPCQRCGTILQLQSFAHNPDGVVNRCPNWRCRHYESVRKHSFFASSHIPLTKQMHLLILFCADSTMTSAAAATGVAQSTVIRFFDECRRLWKQELTFDPIVFDDGGEYEVDELIIQRVYNPTTNTISPIWIQGIYERETGKLALYRARSRTIASLCIPIFLHVPAGSFIYTDDFSSYLRLDRADSPYGHFSVNHSRHEYLRVETLADGTQLIVSTNTIEGIFNHVRSRLAYRARRNTDRVDLILAEIMFRYTDRSLFASFKI